MTESVLTKVSLKTVVLKDLVSRAFKCCSLIDVLPMTMLMNLTVKNNTLYVKTTDNVNHFTAFANVQNVPDFEMTVDAKLFSSLVSKLNTEFTSLTLEGNKVTVESNGTYNIALVAEENGDSIKFPEIEITPIGASFHITGQEVKSILGMSKACKADNKDVPSSYNYYANAESVLTTDGEKACLNPVKITDIPIAITPNVMDLLSAVMDESGVDIYQNTDTVVFESTVARLIGKKACQADVDEFPADALVEIVNTNADTVIKLNRTALLASIDRISLFSQPYDQDVLTLKFDNKKVTLLAMSTGSEEAVNYIDDKITSEIDFKCEVKAPAFKEMLSACDQESLPIGFLQDNGIAMSCGSIKLLLSEAM